MMVINGYELQSELKTTNSGFSKWGFARKNGSVYFIKEFIDPIYPVCTDVLDPAMIEHKRKICTEYEARSKLLYKTINECSDGNLVYVEDFFRAESHFYLVMERIQAISLEEVSSMSEKDKIRICKVLIHSIGGLHKQGIVHADIKLDNILFHRLSAGTITGKVIDFDNCFWESQPPSPEEEIHGDPVYMAPETFLMMQEESGKLTRAIDVFALGLVFHQIFTGRLPDFDMKAYDYPFEAVLDGASLIYSNTIPEKWRNLIVYMTLRDADERITLEDAEVYWKDDGDVPFVRPVSVEPTSRDGFQAAGDFFSPAGDL